MLTYEEFNEIIQDTKNKCKNLFFINNDVLDIELEKDIIYTYLMVKIKYLHKCKNTSIILSGFIDKNMNIDIKKVYNVYTKEVEEILNNE